jgi:hypothetical protein
VVDWFQHLLIDFEDIGKVETLESKNTNVKYMLEIKKEARYDGQIENHRSYEIAAICTSLLDLVSHC